MLRKFICLLLCLGIAFAGPGCARTKELENINARQAAQISSLQDELAKLNSDLAALQRSKSDLEKTQDDLEKKLRTELSGGDLTLAMGDRGLVLTVLDKVLFDSGKAAIKDSAKNTMDKVAETLSRNVQNNMIFVEGHTDNDPIRHSGWKSNWELSTARATEVIHYLAEQGGVEPKRLVAAGYAEYHPVASNDATETKQKNRRVEIIISPRKQKDSTSGVAAKAVSAGGDEVLK